MTEPAERRAVWAALALLIVLGALPYLAARYPPFQDLPGHVGAAAVLVHHPDPTYRTALYYDLDVRVTPYALFQSFAWLVGQVAPLGIAARAYLVLFGALGLPLAFLFACWAFRRDRALALLAVPLAFSHVVFYGFVDSVGALPLALVGLGLVERTSAARRPWEEAALAGVGCLVAVAHGLMLCWLLAMGAVLALCHAPRPAAFARRMLWAVPGAAALGLGLGNLAASELATKPVLRFGWPPFAGTYPGLGGKLADIVRWLFDNYVPVGAEDALAAVWLGTILALAVIAVRLRRSAARAPAPAPPSAPPSGDPSPPAAQPPPWRRFWLLGVAAVLLGGVIAAPVLAAGKAAVNLRWLLLVAALFALALQALRNPWLAALALRHRVAVLFAAVALLYFALPRSLPNWFAIDVRLVVPLALTALLLVPEGTLRGRRLLALAPAALATAAFSIWLAADFRSWDATRTGGLDSLAANVPIGARYIVVHDLHTGRYRTSVNLYDCGWLMAEKGGVCQQIIVVKNASWVVRKDGRYPSPGGGKLKEWRCDRHAPFFDYVFLEGAARPDLFACDAGNAFALVAEAPGWHLYGRRP